MAKKNDIKAAPSRKFFFDINDFNDDHDDPPEEEIIEDLPPPPPTFSEEELEAARKEGYERGKRDGLAEAQASREKFVSTLLETISKSFATLFSAENERTARYETEATILARSIFRKLFPTLNAHHGLAEVETVIASVLEGARETAQITIEVHPDYIADIETHARHVMAGLHGIGEITVSGNFALGPGDCKLAWNAGGAHRAAPALATEIEKELARVLADRAGLHDNISNISENSDDNSSGNTPGPTADNGGSP